MKKNKSILFPPVNDRELLEKAFLYFRDLRSVLPSNRLKDSCSGILALIFILLSYLDSKNLDDYGNNEK